MLNLVGDEDASFSRQKAFNAFFEKVASDMHVNGRQGIVQKVNIRLPINSSKCLQNKQSEWSTRIQEGPRQFTQFSQIFT